MDKVIIKNVRLPKTKIEKIICFVTPKGLKLPAIIIKPARGEWLIDGIYYANDHEILLKVAKYSDFPFKMTVSKKEKKKGYMDGFSLKNKQEALVYLLAHEIRHVWQAKHPTAKRMGRRKNKYSESDADIYAVNKLNQWRENKKFIA